MRTVDHQEGSEAWRAWRHQGLGSSDAPAVVGLSRYLDGGELWRRKRAPPQAGPDDLRLARGRALEPLARAAVAARIGCPLSPRCVEHDQHPELRASLDGYCDPLGLPLEIKCASAALHAEALGGRIPTRFVPQCLHILIVTGAVRLLYASYRPEARRAPLALLELSRHPSACEQLQRLELEFWRAVQAGATPPRLRLALPPLTVRPLPLP